MFGFKKRHERQHEFEAFLAEHRKLELGWARAITEEHLTGEQRQKALESIAKAERPSNLAEWVKKQYK